MWLSSGTMYIKNALKGDVIRNLFFNGRHLDCWFVNSCQYLMDLEPALRLQVDYIFVSKTPCLTTGQSSEILLRTCPAGTIRTMHEIGNGGLQVSSNGSSRRENLLVQSTRNDSAI